MNIIFSNPTVTIAVTMFLVLVVIVYKVLRKDGLIPPEDSKFDDEEHWNQ